MRIAEVGKGAWWEKLWKLKHPCYFFCMTRNNSDFNIDTNVSNYNKQASTTKKTSKEASSSTTTTTQFGREYNNSKSSNNDNKTDYVNQNKSSNYGNSSNNSVNFQSLNLKNM